MSEQLLDTIDVVDDNIHMIVWDLGRRCNFDCTYCTTYMHNNWSPHASLEKLKETMVWIDEYYSIYSMFHNVKWNKTITFTGGEPTVNPAFFDLVKWIYETYPGYKISLTTNGTWDKRKLPLFNKYIHGTTVSYHTEAAPKLKKKVIANTLALKEMGANVKVNVMMHAGDEQFQECKDLISDVLEPAGVRFIPRIIGERLEVKKWADGKQQKRQKVHEYTPEQADYMRSYWTKQNAAVAKKKTQPIEEANNDMMDITVNAPDSTMDTTAPPNLVSNIKNIIPLETINKSLVLAKAKDMTKGTLEKKKVVGRSMGRGCCGGRLLSCKSAESQDWDNAKFVPNTNFKGWKCMINWFFLHIEQEKDIIYHHQTCRTSLNSVEEPIGSVTDKHLIIEELERYIFDNNELPYITCPHDLCGCGMCVPKAKNADDAKELWNKYVKYPLRPA